MAREKKELAGDQHAAGRQRCHLLSAAREASDPHLDFTHPAAREWWTGQLRGLIRRGVDGVKVDRGSEEDLSDESVWFNGLHNRDNYNAYIGLYHKGVTTTPSAQSGSAMTSRSSRAAAGTAPRNRGRPLGCGQHEHLR